MNPLRYAPLALLLVASLAAPGRAAAQERGERPRTDNRGGGDRQSERPSRREQSDERPRVSVGAAVQRASAGRPGRFLGASNRGDTVVVRWEYPGGRVADIMVDGRTGRVIGER